MKEDVPLEGYLMKKSPGKLHGWQRRWFSLKGYNLFYYSGKKDNSLFDPFSIERAISTWYIIIYNFHLDEAQRPNGSIPLEEIIKVRNVSELYLEISPLHRPFHSRY